MMPGGSDEPTTVWGQEYDVDPEYAARLSAKLDPATLRLTLAFSAMYQLAHELLKDAVIGNLAGFYGRADAAPSGWLWEGGREKYATDVLALAPNKGPFVASLEWYVQNGAISAIDVTSLEAVYAHRHELTHDLATYLVDIDKAPDVNLFATALEALRAICAHWAKIEVDLGTIDMSEVEAVVSGRVALLEACLDAVTGEL